MSDPKPTASSTKSKAFKPRAGIVRKTKAEREAHLKQEAEKAAVRAAAAAQAAGKSSQTTKPNASKKREPTRDNRDGSQNVAAGVFGAGTGTRQGWKKSIVDGGRSEMLEGQEGMRPGDGPALQGQDGTTNDGKRQGGAGGGSGYGGAGMSGGRGSRLMQDGTVIESDDEPDEPRRDIERIWISSDEEDEDQVAGSKKGKARAPSEGQRVRPGGGLRPVRAPRTLAEEQQAAAEERGEKKTVKSSRTVVDDAEGEEDGEEMELDNEPTIDQQNIKHDVPSSPELSKRLKPGRKVGTRAKDNRLAMETVEERAERTRLYEDVEKLREEFVTAPKIKKQDDVEMQDKELRPKGKLFLFQFPPLIPFLVEPAAMSSTGLEGGQPTTEAGPRIKSDPDGPPVEAEDDATEAHTLPKSHGMLTAKEEIKLPPGLVGKLRVHRSGKVTLDWGGTDMEVRYGTEVDFLQDAVLVETRDRTSETDEKPAASQTGTTYALGQVQKKMIVIPDWQKLYE